MATFVKIPQRRPSSPRPWIPFPIRLRVAHARAWLVRRRAVRRVAIAAAVVVVSLVVRDAVTDAGNARTAWGQTAAVVVARVDVEAGSPVADARLELRDLPLALVVDDALDALPRPDDRVRWRLRPGDVVTRRHMASGGHVLAPNERAISIPTGPVPSALAAGDLVDIVLIADQFGAGTVDPLLEREPRPESIEARILDVGNDSATVAVDTSDMMALARTLTRGDVLIARR